MTQDVLGVIVHNSARRNDYLYRVSVKCLIQNDKSELLVVKETGRHWWDLPGGGMDHGESIKKTIAREMKEEVNLTGEFSYEIVAVEEPDHLPAHNFWQIRLIYKVEPASMLFSAGADGDEVAFIDPDSFKNSKLEAERRVYAYSQSLK